MHGSLVAAANRLSDADLLRRLAELAGSERHATVELIAHLAEFDRRKLYREEGYGSLFSYCTAALRLSEHATFNRIEAARASRKFPVILDLLEDGAVNLSTVRLLAPHLTKENHEQLLAEARGRGKREVEAIVARIAPQPDVPPSVRKLPAPPVPARRSADAIASPPAVPARVPADSPARPLAVPPVESRVAASAAAPATGPAVRAGEPAPPQPPAQRPVVTPLTPERYRIQFTVTRGTQEKLRRVQDLLRREIPDGNPGTIFDRALTLLLEDVARKRLAATTNPRSGRGGDPRSRHIPAEVKRKVWIRDHGQCGFISAGGRRCRERTFLEFHHVDPYALSGETTVAKRLLAVP